MLRHIIVALALLVATSAEASYRSASPVEAFPDSANVPSKGAVSVLKRHRHAVSFYLDTDGLDPNSPYTIWAVIFDRPHYCLSSPCTAADLPVSFGHDPRAEASVVFATGGVSDMDGKGRFVGHVRTVAGRVLDKILFGNGSLRARKAEIHLIVRGHGMPPPESFAAAISSFDGGCTDDNPCADQQFSVHLPRRMR